MAGRSPISVQLLPGSVAPGGLAVVVDVLRATTVMPHALASGCAAIVPCLEVDEARRVAASLPAGSTLLGGERAGLPIEGFDLGNSPGDYTPERCRGRTLVMTTTNGTKALLASLAADRVLAASFVNLEATARLLEADGRPVQIVCAGTDGLVSLEDTLLAGALVARLTGDLRDNRPLDDAARIAAAFWGRIADEVRQGWTADGPNLPLLNALIEGRGGRRVREIGLEADLRVSAWIDRLDLTVELRRDPLRLVVA